LISSIKQCTRKKQTMGNKNPDGGRCSRARRTKLKQTEVDCEFLKRCCEALTEENRRLQRELQELRALKFLAAPPTAPATLTTACPSCDHRLGDPDRPNKQGRSRAATRHHLFSNPFTHSAAC
jgi:homeobox-leucine zipper protein